MLPISLQKSSEMAQENSPGSGKGLEKVIPFYFSFLIYGSSVHVTTDRGESRSDY